VNTISNYSSYEQLKDYELQVRLLTLLRKLGVIEDCMEFKTIMWKIASTHSFAKNENNEIILIDRMFTQY